MDIENSWRMETIATRGSAGIDAGTGAIPSADDLREDFERALAPIAGAS